MADRERLRILHVVLSMAVGGAEKLVFDMVRHGAFAGDRPMVCCLREVGDLGERLRREGYAVHCRPGSVAGMDWGSIGWIRDIIESEAIDVVHAHQYPAFFYAVPAAFLAGRRKVVYTEHGRLFPDRRHWKRYLVNPMLALGARHLVSISESTKRAMGSIDNLPLGRIRIIPNGVDFCRMNPEIDTAAKRRELGLEDGCRVVGTAARLEEIKNLPMMLRAFGRVAASSPNACLVVAGEGTRKQKLKELARELGLADRVRFIGLRFDMPEVYRLFEVFLLTSFTEGVSVTLLEAMASGVPAVVTDVGGNPEVVVEGVTGYLVPLGEEALLAEKVLGLLDDPCLAATLGGNGRARALERFGFDVMVDKYRSLYLGP